MDMIDINDVDAIMHDLRGLSGLLYGLSASSSGGVVVGEEELGVLAGIAADAAKRIDKLFSGDEG